MNPLNYGSLEACKRLVDNGIVLETEAVWRKNRDQRVEPGYHLTRKALYHRKTDIPAPCMAEVWRELPSGAEIISQKGNTVCMHATFKHRFPYIESAPGALGWFAEKKVFNTNPTDALIDLLIWEGKEARDERSHNSAEQAD